MLLRMSKEYVDDYWKLGLEQLKDCVHRSNMNTDFLGLSNLEFWLRTLGQGSMPQKRKTKSDNIIVEILA
jgi:hypothetical protein